MSTNPHALAKQICDALIVHGFENDAGAETVIRQHEPLIAKLLQRRLDPPALEGDDFQLLAHLKRDNTHDSARPVISKSPAIDQAFRLSDQGLIALEQVAAGVRLHITRKGVAALAAFAEAGRLRGPSLDRTCEAQALLDQIVARMVAARYPVECTHKRGHRPDHIPADTYGGWTDKLDRMTGASYFESNLASALIGGWHSKAALVQLVIELRKQAAL